MWLPRGVVLVWTILYWFWLGETLDFQRTLVFHFSEFDMERFQQELRHYEGVRYDIYPDPLHGASHATVGVGHLLIPGDKHYG